MKQSTAEFVEELTPQQGAEISPQIHAENDKSDFSNEKTILLSDIEDIDSVWLKNINTSEWIQVSEYPFIIGRGDESNLQLKNRGISRQHASVLHENGSFVIEDSGSLNGIKVNNHKVGRIVLEEGDTIKLGGTTFSFHLQQHLDTSAKSPQLGVYYQLTMIHRHLYY